ncbi:unnamed protein product [Rhodiola kirilowii]
MGVIRLVAFLFVICIGIQKASSATNSGDVAALQSLMHDWENTPPSWSTSSDPCEKWEGIGCTKSRVTSVGLSTMGLKGSVTGDIGGLTELISLDLSYNPGLTGTLSSQIGDLPKLSSLSLIGCGFSGSIPDELGNLSSLTFLALNSNNFKGSIPASIGRLTNLVWLDLADNQLTGPIPVTKGSVKGLDQLYNAKHFHFNKNQLSGDVPDTLFSPQMHLIHVIFDGNQFTGNIPKSLGTVKTLEVLRLDRNSFDGDVPDNLNNLTQVTELHLAQNKLTGPFPNLTGMDALNYVDLSNNSFDASVAPDWFSTLRSLTTLIVENGSLQGSVPQTLFSFPQLQQVRLKNNAFSGTLNMGNSISQQLSLIDLENNNISTVVVGPGYTKQLILIGNPACTTGGLSSTPYCKVQTGNEIAYSTSLANCATQTCSSDTMMNPQSCICAFPYKGTMFFRAPSFSDLSNATTFQSLELSLWTKLKLSPGSVYLDNIKFNDGAYLLVDVALFPSEGKYFNRSEVQVLGYSFSNQIYKPPHPFGPYYLIASPYDFEGSSGGTSISKGLIAGIAVGCALLILVLVGVAVYAVRQKKRAEQAIHLSKPFASWVPSGNDNGGAPQLKGARWFSYDEIKKGTNNFASSNEVGSGGYGKVYRGLLAEGQVVAIKRAQQGSTQGGLEFKTEIELLSRVHHKNLVALIGFCFEQGEQMLVYEYMANGTIRDSLSGRSGIHLDWKKRLRIALGSARGIAYLHDLADPPIIHRDIKSTNILLDEKLVAKVADFGLSKLVSDTGKGHVSTQVKGTLGYLDPEYYMTQQLSEKSDVYSFGVFMLELITGKQPIEKGKYIVREVRTVLNLTDQDLCGLRDMIDPGMNNATSPVGFRRFVELAMQCVEEEAVNRPTMSEVVKTIEVILQDEGLNTNSTSAASSATDFTSGKIPPQKHLYDEGLQRRETSDSDAFEYSGGYSHSAKIEPK